jgi:hypothetical protein
MNSEISGLARKYGAKLERLANDLIIIDEEKSFYNIDIRCQCYIIFTSGVNVIKLFSFIPDDEA